MLKILSTVVVLVLFYGFSKRTHPRIHIPVMLGAFVVDMGMVIYIELNRHAVETALKPNPPVMVLHLVCSVIVVLLYLFQIVSGVLRYRKGGLKFHRYTGILFMVFRVLNLITSFLIPTTG